MSDYNPQAPASPVKSGKVRGKSGKSPKKYRIALGSGGLRNGTKSARVWKKSGKVRNGPGPLSEDRSDPRLRPMTEGESKANAQRQGGSAKVRKKSGRSPEYDHGDGKSGKVQKSSGRSPGKSREVREKSGKGLNGTGAGLPMKCAGA
eukprot:gene17997-biopygen8982